MPLIAIPTTVNKGTPATFTLDRNGLAQIPSVAADQYFSDVSNWDRVVMVYKNALGASEAVQFNAVYLQPTGEFLVTPRTIGGFDFYSLTIYDFDNGYIRVPLSELPVEEFEVEFAPLSQLLMDGWMALANLFSLSDDYVG